VEQATIPVTPQHALGEQPTRHRRRPRNGTAPKVSSSIMTNTLPRTPDNHRRRRELDETDLEKH
jgi:hypothetical protein